MKQKKTIICSMIILVLGICLCISIFYQYNRIRISAPMQQYGAILSDNSLLFWGDAKGGIALLSESCDAKSTFIECSSILQQYDALIMQGSGKNVEETVLTFIDSYPIKHLLIHDNVSEEFLSTLQAQKPKITISRLSKGKHYVLEDILLYVEDTFEDTVSLSFEHGMHSFVVSSEICAKQKHFTYAIMPNEALLSSDITCDYTIVDSTFDKDILLSCASQLMDFGAGAIYFADDGTNMNVLGSMVTVN